MSHQPFRIDPGREEKPRTTLAPKRAPAVAVSAQPRYHCALNRSTAGLNHAEP